MLLLVWVRSCSSFLLCLFSRLLLRFFNLSLHSGIIGSFSCIGFLSAHALNNLLDFLIFNLLAFRFRIFLLLRKLIDLLLEGSAILTFTIGCGLYFWLGVSCGRCGCGCRSRSNLDSISSSLDESIEVNLGLL